MNAHCFRLVFRNEQGSITTISDPVDYVTACLAQRVLLDNGGRGGIIHPATRSLARVAEELSAAHPNDAGVLKFGVVTGPSPVAGQKVAWLEPMKVLGQPLLDKAPLVLPPIDVSTKTPDDVPGDDIAFEPHPGLGLLPPPDSQGGDESCQGR